MPDHTDGQTDDRDIPYRIETATARSLLFIEQ